MKCMTTLTEIKRSLIILSEILFNLANWSLSLVEPDWYFVSKEPMQEDSHKEKSQISQSNS